MKDLMKPTDESARLNWKEYKPLPSGEAHQPPVER
jgi:hypothetical protein